MINQIILVGRIARNLEIINTKEEKKVAYITIAVPRSFKNVNGEYSTDFINCTLWNELAENTIKYCKKGDVIGIKGRIQQNNKNIEIIAERATFLSSKKEN